MPRFTDQVVLITGAGSGIGRATALYFAREGAQVIVSDINESSGQQTTSFIKAEAGRASFILCDVARPEQIASLVQQVVSEYGHLDIAINNAGIGVPCRR
ncbi:SDR family NAD(P)-dependent oxidoreductase [Salmonirosea aquatica]|uniref:SDR family NAD(P)-dependent oxidoreductase n=1 Tax=Salmonirosea aquatica TaxID=2654236 RepID=UPI003570A426